MGYIEDMHRTIRHSAPPKSKHVEALWRGTVTDVRSDGLLRVRIPALGGTASLGPMPTAAPGAVVGSSVIVGAIGGQYAELMVLSFSGTSHTGTVGRVILAANTIPQAKTAIGLSDVDNTSDLDKPLSTDVIAALGTKAPMVHAHALSSGTGTILNSQLPVPVEIGLNADLNDYLDPGDFHQTQNADTTNGFNYPVPLAGLLEVRCGPTPTFVYQRYTIYTGARSFWRVKYAANWSTWKEYSIVGHGHAWTEITAKPTTFAPVVGTGAADAKAGNWFPAWTEVTSKPAVFAPIVGTGAADAKAGNWFPTWTEVTSKPATFAPIIGTTSVTAKAGDWLPSWTDVSGKPTTFTPATHSHAAADTTTGVFAAALLPAATAAVQGAMSAADKAKLDAATSAGTAGTLVQRSAGGAIAVTTGTGATDAANKAYVDTFRHRKAEYTTNNFGVQANQSWDAGPYGADVNTGRTVGTSFSTVTGAVSGAVIITETGFYTLSALIGPDVNPGAAYIRIVLYNSNGTLAELLTQSPNGGSNSWESVGHVPVPVYITANQYVRVHYVAQTNHNISSRLRIWKQGTLGTWGM